MKKVKSNEYLMSILGVKSIEELYQKEIEEDFAMCMNMSVEKIEEAIELIKKSNYELMWSDMRRHLRILEWVLKHKQEK